MEINTITITRPMTPEIGAAAMPSALWQYPSAAVRDRIAPASVLTATAVADGRGRTPGMHSNGADFAVRTAKGRPPRGVPR